MDTNFADASRQSGRTLILGWGNPPYPCEFTDGRPDLPVLVLSMHDDPVRVRRAFQAGADGYVSEQEMTETLLIAIRCVFGGERCVSPKMGRGLDTA